MIIYLSNALSILDVISVIVVILLAVCAIALLACISLMMYDIEHRFSLKETLCMHMCICTYTNVVSMCMWVHVSVHRHMERAEVGTTCLLPQLFSSLIKC